MNIWIVTKTKIPCRDAWDGTVSTYVFSTRSEAVGKIRDLAKKQWIEMDGDQDENNLNISSSDFDEQINKVSSLAKTATEKNSWVISFGDDTGETIYYRIYISKKTLNFTSE